MVHCPSIAPETFQLCVQHIHQSRDPSLYQNLLGAYEQLTNNPDLSLPNMMELAELDVQWEDTLAKNKLIVASWRWNWRRSLITWLTRASGCVYDLLLKYALLIPFFYFLDGTSGPRRFLSWLWFLFETLHQITRVLYEPTCVLNMCMSLSILVMYSLFIALSSSLSVLINIF